MGSPGIGWQQGGYLIRLFAQLSQEHGQALGHNAGHTFAQADVDQQFVAVTTAGETQQAVPGALVGRILRGQMFDTFGTQGLSQQFFAQREGFGVGHGLEVVPNLGTGSASGDEPQPGRVGSSHGGSDDFHHVPIAQLGAQRYLFAVDARRHGAVPNVAVHRIGKVHDGSPSRHGHDLAFGGEHVDGIGEQIDLDVVPELGGVARFVLDVEQ